jgi:cell division protease FtsH
MQDQMMGFPGLKSECDTWPSGVTQKFQGTKVEVNSFRTTLVSHSQLLARIITTLGGRVAEKVVFGDPKITMGASNDLQQVTNIARQMVGHYGMSSIGPIALEENNSKQMFLGGQNDTITDQIDTEVCKIIDHCEQVATKIVLDNQVIIDLIVE